MLTGLTNCISRASHELIFKYCLQCNSECVSIQGGHRIYDLWNALPTELGDHIGSSMLYFESSYFLRYLHDLVCGHDFFMSWCIYSGETDVCARIENPGLVRHIFPRAV